MQMLFIFTDSIKQILFSATLHGEGVKELEPGMAGMVMGSLNCVHSMDWVLFGLHNACCQQPWPAANSSC